MLRMPAFERARALGTPCKSPDISNTSAVSMATSVPVPMATPTSAWARAGASLMPSPTKATRWPSFWSARIASASAEVAYRPPRTEVLKVLSITFPAGSGTSAIQA